MPQRFVAATLQGLDWAVGHPDAAVAIVTGLCTSYDVEKPLHLVGGERGRRLIEDQDTRLDRERLRDFDQLLVGHRKAAHDGRRIKVDAEAGEYPVRRASHLTPVEGAKAS